MGPPFPRLFLFSKPSKCPKILIRGVWGHPPASYKRQKITTKKPIKKTDGPPWPGISSMQSPTQPTVVIVGLYIRIDKAKKHNIIKKRGKK